MASHALSRRRFIALSAATLAATRLARAYPLGLPLGMQLYSVRKVLPTDYAGTLKQIGALGYKEVEAAGFYDHSPDDVKAAMTAAGLNCVSAHYPLGVLMPQLDSIITYGKAVGLQYIVCSSSQRQTPGAKGPLTLDDWKWVANQFNQIGAKVQAAGMSFAYHNHTPEFTAVDGTLPWELLEKNTDPAKVSFEMDCVLGDRRWPEPDSISEEISNPDRHAPCEGLQRRQAAIGSARHRQHRLHPDLRGRQGRVDQAHLR